MIQYFQFRGINATGKAGKQAAEFLEKNKDAKIITIQFTNTATYAQQSHRTDFFEFCHLVVDCDRKLSVE